MNTPSDLSSIRDEDAPVSNEREQHPILSKVFYGLAIIIALWHIYTNTLGTVSELWNSVIHFAAFGLLAALTIPAIRTTRQSTGRVVLAVDILLGLAAVSCALYLMLFENNLYARGVVFNGWDWFFSILAVALILEFARRATGWFIPTLAFVALTYVPVWGAWVSGMFHFPGLTWETTLYRSFIAGEGMLGSIANISWSFVFMFILFGAFLIKSGAGDFIIDIAKAVAGRFIGGPGLVAVFSSGLMGSVSGSSVANTVSTGVITIPLMRKAGFPAKFAAGVEAAASTGGQLMPPIMGAGAFIMASYTQLPYLTIIAYAALPALLYFLSVAMFVRVEARRSGVQKVEENPPKVIDVFKKGWHCLLPIAVLVTALIYGFTPTYSAGIAIISVIVASWLSSNPMNLKDVMDSLVLGTRNMVTTAILLLTVGLIVNVVSTTGIGNTFSLLVTDWAGGSLFITIVLIALASLILGMGLPVTAAYIVLATLSAPALYVLIAESQLLSLLMSGQLPQQAQAIFMLAAPDAMSLLSAPMDTETAQSLLAAVPPDFKTTLLQQALSPHALGMALLSAHMIIFWLSQDSNVTPPVCLTAFAAAAIAKTPPMATGFTAWKISKGLYIIPVLFAYTSFIGGSNIEIIKIFFFALFGIYALVAAMEGYLEHPLNLFLRAVLAVIGLSMLWPHGLLLIDLAGLIAFLAMFAWSYKTNPPKLQAA
ncbi:TRAP transporter permease [Nitrincola tibetensis]|uniref:TRAP transporter permease n=1 Tax=Nitrincola tibetensis TaxID=2219697 RepID=A0A364NRS4_9GAMM|nr:TRAP transporter permease [Nitrincola tibetensis]RAU19786.1 TRAP transporter permease [Nitrincola tibetensis]